MSSNFLELTNEELNAALQKIEIITPTEIQEKTIPIIMEGKDVVACAQTGTGKTLAYLLPIIMKIDKEVKKPQAVVVTLTHELAAQAYKQAEALISQTEAYRFTEPILIIGGANITRQIEKIKNQKPRLIIGSVGRILELIKLKKLSGHYIKTIIIDEADRMLNQRGREEIDALIKTTLADRQIALFSASISKNTIGEANFLKSPEIINMNENLRTPTNIEHSYVICDARDKMKAIRRLYHNKKIKKAIVFFSNPDKSWIHTVASRLNFHQIPCGVLTGELLKNDKRLALEAFKEGRVKILLSTDFAARGLDFNDITHVIHYDMAEDLEIYLHRSGRCGRMGQEGSNICLIEKRQEGLINKMEKAFKIKMNEIIL